MEHHAFTGFADKQRIVATLVAAGTVAAGAIPPVASAGACSNPSFAKAELAAVVQRKNAIGAAYVQHYALAAAEVFIGWRTMVDARMPCDPRLRTVRRHFLRNLGDLWRSYTAMAAGDMVDGLSWLASASKEAARANDGLIIFNRGRHRTRATPRRFLAAFPARAGSDRAA
jgi:hypothetical protein